MRFGDDLDSMLWCPQKVLEKVLSVPNTACSHYQDLAVKQRGVLISSAPYLFSTVLVYRAPNALNAARPMASASVAALPRGVSISTAIA